MTERPILFSGAMVRRILDGSKTQTRRVLRVPAGGMSAAPRRFEVRDGEFYDDDGHDYRCPYGLPGSRLWVREAHALVDGPAWSGLPCTAGPDGRWAYYREGFDRTEPRWRPSIHMPRWACRLTLRVEAMRCESVQAIGDVDALAEGITYTEGHAHRGQSPRDVFAELWDSINAGRGFAWARNPWVWVVTFSQEDAP